MFLRFCSFLIIIALSTSCEKFSFAKNNKTQVLDTIVNFSSVDVSPSFKACDSLLSKIKKTNCFRTIMHNKIGAKLQKHSFAITAPISETVFVSLLINAKGKISLEKIQSSEKIRTELPTLDSLIKASIQKLPNIYPAIKRGIPVTTKYRLPINIHLKE